MKKPCLQACAECKVTNTRMSFCGVIRHPPTFDLVQQVAATRPLMARPKLPSQPHVWSTGQGRLSTPGDTHPSALHTADHDWLLYVFPHVPYANQLLFPQISQTSAHLSFCDLIQQVPARSKKATCPLVALTALTYAHERPHCGTQSTQNTTRQGLLLCVHVIVTTHAHLPPHMHTSHCRLLEHHAAACSASCSHS
jgi:hypothetical protein